MKLTVWAQVENSFETVGYIETFPGSGGEFTYAPSWLNKQNTAPISLSLPLRSEPFKSKQMQPYFEGLLPEEGMRVLIARELGVSATSFLKLLAAIAGECIGAVTIVDDLSQLQKPGLKKLKLEELEMMSRNESNEATRHAARFRLSLAGAQSKTGLYCDPVNIDDWYTPLGTAPSTHILKPQSSRFEDLCRNELWAMRLAGMCDLPVAQVNLVEVNDNSLLAVKRYDRVFQENPETVDGHPIPLRLHQEDFGQALGIPITHKYEEGNSSYLPLLFELIRNESSNPIEDQRQLTRQVAFNVLIGNCDAHLKNYSLIRSWDWKSLSLAPAYDLVSTTVYEELTHVLGMRVGSARKIDDVSLQSFEELAEESHIAPQLVNRDVTELCEQVREVLDSSSDGTKIVDACVAQCKKRLDQLIAS